MERHYQEEHSKDHPRLVETSTATCDPTDPIASQGCGQTRVDLNNVKEHYQKEHSKDDPRPVETSTATCEPTDPIASPGSGQMCVELGNTKWHFQMEHIRDHPRPIKISTATYNHINCMPCLVVDCTQTFSTHDHARDHFRAYHQPRGHTLKCPFPRCARKFKAFQDLMIHTFGHGGPQLEERGKGRDHPPAGPARGEGWVPILRSNI